MGDPPGHALDEVQERTLRGLPKAELHLHFEGAFRWPTIRELHREARALPEHPPWLDPPRPFADFEDFRRVFRDFVRPASGTPETIERHAFEVTFMTDVANSSVRVLIEGHG